MARTKHVHVPAGSKTGEVVAKAAGARGDGQLPLVFYMEVAAGVAANVTLTSRFKARVFRVDAIHTGGAGEASDTLTLQNGDTNAITDDMDWSGADNVVVSAGTIDDAYADVDVGDVLTLVPVDFDTGSDLGAGRVYIYAMPLT